MGFDYTSPDIWASLATLTILEIVLSVDNIVFISIIAGKLPPAQQARAMRIGIMGALVSRVLLVLGAVWIIALAEPLFTLFEIDFSWRDVMLIAGGLFLMVKGTHEIHEEVEGEDDRPAKGSAKQSFLRAVVLITLLDIIFSIDTVFTAVGMTSVLMVMIIAITIATLVMLLAAMPLARFIEKHPTVKMLALSFLLLIGMVLIADGLHFHIPRGYVYAPVAFSIVVEALNLAAARRRARLRAAKQAAGG